jgi:putative membrane protein
MARPGGRQQSRQQPESQTLEHQIPDDKKATEYLANERTFLAWVRNSVSIMSLGFVVAKFGLWLRELASRLSSAVPAQGSGWSGPVGMGMIAFGAAGRMAFSRRQPADRARQDQRR